MSGASKLCQYQGASWDDIGVFPLEAFSMTTKLLSELSVKPSRYHPDGLPHYYLAAPLLSGLPPYFESNPPSGPSIPAQQDAETNLISRQQTRDKPERL